MGAALSQMFPPAPAFTERMCRTKKASGVGKELARILYPLNAKVYTASRARSRGEAAISDIQKAVPHSSGSLDFIEVDLEDLESVRTAAETFLKKEDRLDALWNNAGTMLPPARSKTKQGYELQTGSNTLAPFLLTELLTPLMVRTVKQQGPGSVRILWVASSAAELFSPTNGVDMNNSNGDGVSSGTQYGVSKGGMVLLSQEYAKRYKVDGVISVSMNPGNQKTNLRRHVNPLLAIAFGWMSHDPIKGAYTELFSGFSEDITLENSGCWVIPWGRIVPVRVDILKAGVPELEGGTGVGAKFWDWCQEQVAPYITA
ncbi:NAD(P)-binding protein [Trematosphaeria pertusa]|uniref:NAD(P)-binding protein n=1 Tax=Trematosphaeria pertusa TaxID=390896 RepID=A0A6A6HWD3_9PLEO|nr:NAD(P)-binding protein [Trematosphaeria pertusa]KAF2242505.1 NAD(P)-binding protein [Trematosphaeria pertusa]